MLREVEVIARTWQLLVSATGDTRAAQKELRALQRSTRNFGQNLTNMGKTLTAAVTLPIIAMAGVGIKELMETRAVTMKTDAVFKSMGKTVKVTRSQFDDLVSGLSEYSAIEGDIIQSNANVALSFSALASNPKLFEDTMKAAVDMSAALGQDTQTSVVQLGKAMQNGAKGAGALAKNGTLAKDDIAKLQKMAKDGIPMWKQQEFILKAVNKQYAGQGKNVDPIKAITLAFKDTAEVLAEMLLPFILGFSMAMQDAAKWVKGLTDGQRKMLGVAMLVAAALGPVMIIVGQLATAWAALLPVLAAVAAALGTSIAVILAVVAAIGIVVAALVYAYTTSEGFRDRVNAAFRAVYNGVVMVLGELKATIMVWVGWAQSFWAAHGETIKAVLSKAWDAIRLVVGTYLTVIKNIVIAVLAALRGDWSRAWEAIRAAAAAVWNLIKTALSAAWDGIKAVARAAAAAVVAAIVGALDDAIQKTRSIWSSVGSVLGTAWASIKATAASAAAGVVAAVVDKLNDVVGKLGSLGAQAGAAFANALRAAIESILSKIRNISLPGVTIGKTRIGGQKPFAGVQLADGGIAYGRTLAEVGEYSGARSNPEVIAPLDKLQSMLNGVGGTTEIHVHSASGDPEAIAQRVAKILSSRRVRVGGLA